jgi:hypothetical protein
MSPPWKSSSGVGVVFNIRLFDSNFLTRRLSMVIPHDVALVADKPDPDNADVCQARLQLRDAYMRLIFQHYEVAVAKDVETNLWKNCYYKQIEEYRRALRVTTTTPRSKRDDDQTSHDTNK